MDMVKCPYCGNILNDFEKSNAQCFNCNKKLTELEAELASQDLKRHEQLTNIFVTSGNNFEGYKIIKYHDFISAEVAMGMGLFKSIMASFSDIAGRKSESLGYILQNSKESAMNELKEKTIDKGGNAIIGIDLDYTMFGTTIAATVISGTAVSIEKDIS